MPRIISIDYGKKRTGLAVTDELQIIASGLETVPTEKLIHFLQNYFQKENVESIVIGMPLNLDQRETHATASVVALKQQLINLFPENEIFTID
ncbi:MAG: RuvX/YqgF family protein, partial [Bacteroidota bacterium]